MCRYGLNLQTSATTMLATSKIANVCSRQAATLTKADVGAFLAALFTLT